MKKAMPRKSKIAFVVTDMEGGGAQRVAAQLCNSWAKRGEDVTLFSFDPPDRPPFYELSNKVKFKPLGLKKKSDSGIWRFINNVMRVIVFHFELRRLKPTVLISFSTEVAVVCLVATTILKIPVIACERANPRIFPLSKTWRAMRKLTYWMAHEIVVQTGRAAAFFKKATVIPNPVTKPDISGPVKPENLPAQFIVSLARLGPEKRLNVLIDAFANLAADYPDLHVVLIGLGTEREALEAQAKERRLADRVHLTGAIQGPFPAMVKAELFVLPSSSEGFPNALCEAMALGLPCISTHEAVGADIIRDGENGLLVHCDNVQGLETAIRYLLDDKSKAGQMGEEAKKITKDLAPEKVLEQWGRSTGSLRDSSADFFLAAVFFLGGFFLAAFFFLVVFFAAAFFFVWLFSSPFSAILAALAASRSIFLAIRSTARFMPMDITSSSLGIEANFPS